MKIDLHVDDADGSDQDEAMRCKRLTTEAKISGLSDDEWCSLPVEERDARNDQYLWGLLAFSNMEVLIWIVAPLLFRLDVDSSLRGSGNSHAVTGDGVLCFGLRNSTEVAYSVPQMEPRCVSSTSYAFLLGIWSISALLMGVILRFDRPPEPRKTGKNLVMLETSLVTDLEKAKKEAIRTDCRILCRIGTSEWDRLEVTASSSDSKVHPAGEDTVTAADEDGVPTLGCCDRNLLQMFSTSDRITRLVIVEELAKLRLPESRSFHMDTIKAALNDQLVSVRSAAALDLLLLPKDLELYLPLLADEIESLVINLLKHLRTWLEASQGKLESMQISRQDISKVALAIVPLCRHVDLDVRLNADLLAIMLYRLQVPSSDMAVVALLKGLDAPKMPEATNAPLGEIMEAAAECLEDASLSGQSALVAAADDCLAVLNQPAGNVDLPREGLHHESFDTVRLRLTCAVSRLRTDCN